MGASKAVAIVAVLAGLVAVAMNVMVITTEEFVEVFVKLPDSKTSCRIGSLGVYEGSFDAGCLSEADQISAGLDAAPTFDGASQDFFLLFPAQSELLNDVSPLNTPERKADTGAVFPEFEDCESYFDTLSAAQPTAWSKFRIGTDPSLFGTGTETVVDLLLGSYWGAQSAYIGALYLGLEGAIKQYFQAVCPTWDQTIANKAGDCSGFQGQIAAVTSTAGLNGTDLVAELQLPESLAVFYGSILDSYKTDLGFPSVVAFDLSIDAVIIPGCENITDDAVSCVLGALFGTELSVTEPLSGTTEFSAAICEAAATYFTGAALTIGQCGIATTVTGLPLTYNFAAGLGKVLGDLGGFLGSAQIAGAAAVAAIPAVKTYFDNGLLLGFTDSGSYPPASTGTPHSTISTTTNATLFSEAAALSVITNGVGLVPVTPFPFPIPALTYPTTWTGQYPACTLPTYVQKLQIDPITAASDTETACQFRTFIANYVAVAEAAGITGDDLADIKSFVGLFQQCDEAGLTNPNDCWAWFPSGIIDSMYQNALNFDDYSTNNLTAYEQAIKKCENNNLDLDAVMFAQTGVYAGLGLVAAGSVIGIVAVLGNKIGAVVGGVLNLAGGVMVLASLLAIYEAPIYKDNVGGDEEPEDYDLLYLPGATVTFGLVQIAMGILSGVLFFVTFGLLMKQSSSTEVTVLEKK